MEIHSLDTFLAYRDSVHARTRRVILCIPPARLEESLADGKWSCGDVVRHLAAIERFMFAENVHGRPSRYPGHGRELADGCDQVIAFYDRLAAESRALFAALGPEQLQSPCETPGGARLAVWKWLRSMLEHEIHHRGQLYLMLGLFGVETPPLYGLTSEEVKARSRPD